MKRKRNILSNMIIKGYFFAEKAVSGKKHFFF